MRLAATAACAATLLDVRASLSQRMRAIPPRLPQPPQALPPAGSAGGWSPRPGHRPSQYTSVTLAAPVRWTSAAIAPPNAGSAPWSRWCGNFDIDCSVWLDNLWPCVLG